MGAMTSPSLSVAPAVWAPPAAVRIRGTLALLAGAGEDAEVYRRFGARIAADGYVVGVFAADETADATAWLGAQGDAPRVLVGSDRGAAAVLTALAAGLEGIDGAIVAGTPAAGADDSAADDAARTACPVHLGVLGATRAETPVAAPIALPSAAALAGIRTPVLAIHGGADTIAPLDAARAALRGLPALEFVETVGGLHDALNDQSHRSVAATIVLWLERLRGAGVDQPIVREVVA